MRRGWLARFSARSPRHVDPVEVDSTELERGAAELLPERLPVVRLEDGFPPVVPVCVSVPDTLPESLPEERIPGDELAPLLDGGSLTIPESEPASDETALCRESIEELPDASL